MDAFRAVLGCACSPTAVASDPEAQLQHSCTLPQDCARSTITSPALIPTLTDLTLYRGTVYSRHDDPPPFDILTCPDDTPPAYTYPPPPMSGSDSPATHETMTSHNLYATAVAVVIMIALFATAIYFSFFHHSKV